jgi:hypothetical protein
VSTLFLGFLLAGMVLGVYAMLYGTERSAPARTTAPHDRRGEHESAGEPSPLFNMASIAAFLFAVGLSGYLLGKGSSLSLRSLVLVAVGIGVIAFALQALLFARWAIPGARAEHVDERYLLQGTVGYVTQVIPSDGQGAIRYALDGQEHDLPAKNFELGDITVGTEVVIERIEEGVAYVERWAQVEKRL